ncbi:hypothetical protein D9611_002875 [Ephemerocybe angulata]|uniref:F-box domain-containing protein n=1 Tax=Ephemerocybe angulata TaxID=980116 RepID=A0A8H5FHA4_9AGAR|nr:hypothetical protein D9611_002875 [Tulosesus angulatus]
MATSKTLIHLLDTNTVPSNVEAASIEQSIAKYDIEIATCEIEIAKLRSQLDALVEQRRRHNAVLSPLRRMPLELLGEIFAMVPLYILDQRGRQDVINLGLVCKRWRDTTIYTHRLWSSVALSPHDGLKAYDKTVSWFEKSGGVPKSLEFSAWMHCGCSDGGDYRCLATNPALTRLLTEGPVLDHFTLIVSRTACFKNWIAAIDAAEKVPGKPRPWDALRSFDLTFNEDRRDRWGELEHDIPEQWCFSLLPPAITALHLYLPGAWAGFGEDEGLSRHGALKIPVEVLNRLITFTIKCDWSGTKLVELLHHCTNVETLTIKFNDGSPLLEERDNPLLHTLAKSRILLPKVRSLRLREAGTAEILRYLSTPAITNLDLGFADWGAEDDDFVDIVPKFLHASDATTSLLSLRIYNLHIAGYDLRQSLDGLDSLKRLTLDKVTWSGNLFIAMKNSDHKCKPRIPSVEQLEILQFPDDRGILPIGSGALMEGIRQGCMPCTLTMSIRGAHSQTWPFFTGESRRTWREKAFMYVQTVPPLNWECLQV